MERNALIKAFLKKNNLENELFEWITGDASFRKYARIGVYPKSFILMDSPLSEKPDKFDLIDTILCQNGLSAPKIYDKDLENGLILLEDFGSSSYKNELNNTRNEEDLYLCATDALLKIAEIKNLEGVPDYDSDVIHTGLSLFTDWFMPQALDKQTDPAEKKTYLDIMDKLFNSIKEAPKGLMLADFHVDNLMLLKDKQGFKACGLLDFQDGTYGPLAYDLMSLVEDARRPINDILKREIIDYYLKNAKFTDASLFMKSYHITAVKRHLRVIGVFIRLKVRDGKDKYLNFIPTVWKLLESHLNEPYLKDLKDWLDKNIPVELRCIPKKLQIKE